MTVEELEREGFETRFALDTLDTLDNVLDASIRIAALDEARKVLAYSDVVSAVSSGSVSESITRSATQLQGPRMPTSLTKVSLWQVMLVCGLAVFGFSCWRYRGVLRRKCSKLSSFRRRRNDRQLYELLESQG